MTDIVEHFTRFAAERRKIRGIDHNEIAGMHVGHEREVILTLADLERAAAEIVALRSALRECADDLAGEIDARNAGDMLKYPTMKARYDRDMEPVVRARALLEGKGS
jgi:hypothetical protein